ncbi:hypothetical protein NDU88_005094 [Pleurodeles waltl]|uniref:Uncharacterized protein n=1 Tax=Pleurodeles waltl TaxID=8319 RepID=A0AAV7PLN5_PLEWA|nr:hypothetical protein NDU88_005094 [Pleurodeles waltl]
MPTKWIHHLTKLSGKHVGYWAAAGQKAMLWKAPLELRMARVLCCSDRFLLNKACEALLAFFRYYGMAESTGPSLLGICSGQQHTSPDNKPREVLRKFCWQRAARKTTAAFYGG